MRMAQRAGGAPPIPTPRPMPAAPAGPDPRFEEEWRNQRRAQERAAAARASEGPYTAPAAGRTHRDAERESMHQLRSRPNEVADALDEALTESARRAGQEIETLAGGAGQGASALDRLVQSFETATARINAAAAGVRVGGMVAPTGNRGQTMPDAGVRRPGVSQ